jgi:AraC family transcriptional regulator
MLPAPCPVATPPPASRFAASGTAIGEAVGFAPEVDSGKAGWSNVALFAWRGHCGEAQFEPFSEPVIVYHVGGAASVPVRTGKLWNRRTHPGQITVIPPETRVSWSIRGEVHSRTVHLGSRFFLGGARAPELRFRCGVTDPLIAAAIQTLEREIRSPAQCGSLYADTVADTLALHLIRDGDAPTEPVTLNSGLAPAVLRRCLDRMEASLSSGISLQALAAEAGLSRAHFAESFRRSTGVTPHRHLTQRRLARARELLRHTALSIADIALRCGFSSQAHFSEYFRRDCGLTPRHFRATVD